MAGYESSFTITLNDSMEEEGIGESIDIPGKYLSYLPYGIKLTGCWQLTIFKKGGDEETHFRVGTAFYPWQRIAEISDVYDDVDGLQRWAQDRDLSFADLQKAQDAFRNFQG
ncbi:hypothetical protein ACFVZH_38625 [Streptomyces sp. NPDC059534]|uniref:hypothetical protein n=1 Tax=Streptomyces sp. NPDC059534 TaxID=3346859 RepID=UPI0036788ADE